MSKPVFEDVFAFHGRRNRKSFFLFNLVAFVLLLAYVSAVLMGIMMLDSAMSVHPSSEPLFALLLLPGILAFCLATLCTGTQRCRDAGWSGWTMILSLLPIVGFPFYLILSVVPGNQGINAYGPDPLF